MKKILSVMLAVLTLFSVLSIGASAVNQIPLTSNIFTENVQIKDVTISGAKHSIAVFDFNGGSSTYEVNVYDADNSEFTYVADFSGRYIMLPGYEYGSNLTAGSFIKTPYVEAPEGYKFNGWFCNADGRYYVAGIDVEIDSSWVGKIVNFQATYIPAKAEGDTMKTVLGVLTKVFGTVLGILFLDGSSASGVALVEKLLAGII